MSLLSADIISINVGQPKVIVHQGKEVTTGIYKTAVTGEVYLSVLNLSGDAQADLVYHGGLDKAVCVYSYVHYPYWERDLNLALVHGAFGENLTVNGLIEDEVCIGDIYEWGEAVVQVSQPRQPCHKLAKRYNQPDLPLRVQNTGYTGFYLRVLKEGYVSAENQIRLISRHTGNITVSFANQIMHHDKHNLQGIQRILEVEELSANWRKTLLKRLEGTDVDAKKRLEGE